MRDDIKEYIRACQVCQQVKNVTGKPQGLIQPLPTPSGPWKDVTMDFIAGLPSSKGFVAILVVVDRFTKCAHFCALRSGYTASQVAENLVLNVIKLHGFPNNILTDRDPLFMSKFWEHLMKCSGTKLLHTTAYHPEGDGQTEIVYRCLEQYLRLFTHQFPQQWVSYLAWAEFWYNTSYHSAIKMSPYQALHGVNPSFFGVCSRVESVDDLLRRREEIQQRLKFNLHKSRETMKKYADKKRRDKEFQVGKWV